jgi:hypothetical protein
MLKIPHMINDTVMMIKCYNSSDRCYIYNTVKTQLKYIKQVFSHDTIIASKHLPFSLSYSEGSSGIRCPVSCVDAVNIRHFYVHYLNEHCGWCALNDY